jgi:phosphonate transport system ATP-binding protein
MSVNIKIRNAIKRYGNNTIISDLSLDIKEGEFFTLLGPSGCGKTTLLRMIAGFNTIEGGDFYFSDKRINDLDPAKRNIGMVFQSFNLVKRTTVIKNVLAARVADMPLWKSLLGLYAKQDKIIALEALDQVGILEKAYSRADQLSGGQQQRVALARTVAQQPKIILADEPVASLDPVTSQQVMNDFVKINKALNITVIANMHHVDIALKYANRIIGVKEGKIVFDGPSLKVTNDILKEIYGRELSDDELMGA